MMDNDSAEAIARDERIAHRPDENYRCCGLCGIYLQPNEAYYPHRCEMNDGN